MDQTSTQIFTRNTNFHSLNKVLNSDFLVSSNSFKIKQRKAFFSHFVLPQQCCHNDVENTQLYSQPLKLTHCETGTLQLQKTKLLKSLETFGRGSSPTRNKSLMLPHQQWWKHVGKTVLVCHTAYLFWLYRV